MLTNLKCLALGGLNFRHFLEIDEIPNAILSNLSKLEELIVERSRIELKGEVVRRLMKLEVFHGWFPTVNDMRMFLKCQPDRLSRYFITVGSNFNSYEYIIDANHFMLFESPYTKMIMVLYVEEMLPRYKKILVFRETSIVGENALLPSVQVLCIKACQDMGTLNDFSAIQDEKVTDLRRCWIGDCNGMKCFLSSWINPIVQTLERLDLYYLDNLDGLFDAEVAKSPPPPGAFSSLKEVIIWNCNKIKNLFPSWKLVEHLQSLEVINIWYCKEMEEIIASDPEEEAEEGEDIIKKLILPKLKKLILYDLYALKSICSRRAVMVCDSLEEAIIRYCKGLRRIPIYLDNAQPSPPPSLKAIKIGQGEQKWWKSLEWDHPNAKNVLQPLLRLYSYSIPLLESEQSKSVKHGESVEQSDLAEQSELVEQSESEEEQSESVD